MIGTRQPKKRAVNLFVDIELLDEARRMNINISETLEQRLRGLVRAEQERRWLHDNQEAIAFYNRRVAERIERALTEPDPVGSEVDRPDASSSSPHTARKVVVFPAPLGPSTSVIRLSRPSARWSVRVRSPELSVALTNTAPSSGPERKTMSPT